MARKTKEETLATRDGILDAAEACFQEGGIANTSLEKIAARAGFTRGAVYWHFKNKGEILAAVITRCRVPFLQKLEQASSDSRNTPVQDLRAVFLNSWMELEASPRLRGLLEIMLRNDLSSDSQILRQTHAEGFRDCSARIISALNRANTLGQLRPGVSAEHAARLLHITLTGVLYNSIFQPGSIDMHRDGMAALDALLGALVTADSFVPGQPPTPPA